MNYFELTKDDWISIFGEHMNKGSIKKTDDGRYMSIRVISIDVPWLYTNMKESPTAGEICYRFHEFYSGKMNIIPLLCHECYKVVVKPRTLKELVALHELQKQLNLPSKCGVEMRDYVPTLYGGYFYNKGIENGKKCYELVRKRVSERISPDIPVILKRACTEFEMNYGDSDKWKPIEGQDIVEKAFEMKYYEENDEHIEFDSDMIAHIQRKWCHFASEQRPPDLTYKEYTGGRPLVPECNYVTYHEDIK